MATKPRVPYPQFDKPGSKISPWTGKPYTAAEKAKVHAATVKRDQASKAKSDAERKKAEEYRKLRAYYDANGHLPTEFANESKRRFDEADSSDASSLGAQVASGKLTKEQALEQIRRGVAVNDPNRLRVGLDVAAELDPQLNAIERRRKLAKETLDRTLTSDQSEAGRTAAHIKGIYDAILTKLQGGQGQVQQNYEQTSGRVNDQYAALQKTLQENAARANAQTQAQVAGMQGGTTQGQVGTTADTNAYAAIAGIQNQGIQGTLATQRGGASQLEAATANYHAFSGADQQAQIMRALQERAAELRAEYGAEDYELGGQYADLDESRYNRLYEGRQALEDQQQQAILDAEDRAYEREMAERALGIKEYTAETGRYAVDAATERHNAKLRQDAQVAANRHNLEVQRLKIEQSKLSDPLQKQLIQAKIDKESALATKALADAQKATKGSVGDQDKYTQAMSVIQNIPGIRGDQVNYLQGLVDSAAARADYDKFFITKGNEFLMDRLNADGYQDDATRRYVRQALAILLGVV